MKDNLPPNGPSPDAAGNGESLLQDLRRRGYRFSESRRHLISILATVEKAASVVEVYRALRTKAGCESISLMTVYRHVLLLWREGFLARVAFEEGAFRYLLLPKTVETAVCDLVICRKCGALHRFQASIPGVAKQQGYAIARHRLVFYGLCRECRKVIGICILGIGYWVLG